MKPFIEWWSDVDAEGYYVAKYGVRKQVALMRQGATCSEAVAYFTTPAHAVQWASDNGVGIIVHDRLTCEDTCQTACLHLCGQT